VGSVVPNLHLLLASTSGEVDRMSEGNNGRGPPREAQPSDSDLDGIDVDILEDGTVRLHAICRPGEDPSACADRVQFLVDALGLSLDGVLTEISPAGSARKDGYDGFD